jgi:hypothetical protein
VSGGNLNGVRWGSYSHDCDASTENKTTDGDLSNGIRGASDDGADDDDYASSGHGNAAAKAIGDGSSDRSSDDGAPERLVSMALQLTSSTWPES